MLLVSGMRTPSPEQELVSAVFSNPDRAAEVVRAFFPKAAIGPIDLRKATYVPGSFVTDDFATRHADVLFRQELPEGDALVYLLFDRSEGVAPATLAFQVSIYLEGVLRHWSLTHPEARRGPIVLPLVVRLGGSTPTQTRH